MKTSLRRRQAAMARASPLTIAVVLRGTCAISTSPPVPPMAAKVRTSYRSGWRMAIQRPKARPAPGKKVFLEACTGLRCARLARSEVCPTAVPALDSGATSVT